MDIFNAKCCQCFDGYFTKADKSTHYICQTCGYKLACPLCGAEKTLTIRDKGVKVVRCGACQTAWFWNENEQPKKKSKSKESCAYCGGENDNCPYCSQRCPKCTSKNITPKDGVVTCDTCLVRFPTTMIGGKKKRKKKRKKKKPKTGLITDPHEVRRLASVFIEQRCPVCDLCTGSPETGKDNLMRCSNCGVVWNDDKSLADPEDQFEEKAFHDQDCPCCKENGQIIQHLDGSLECFVCGTKFDDGSAKVTKESKVSRFKDFANTCPSCNKGFVEDGYCNHCATRVNTCTVCEDLFRAELCPTCAIATKTIKCPECMSVEQVGRGAIYCKCKECDRVYPIAGFSGPSATHAANEFEPEDIDKFLRYQEVAEDIDDFVDEALDLINSAHTTLGEGRDPKNNLCRVEEILQALAEKQGYIDSGGGENESSSYVVKPDEDHLWEEGDGDDEDWTNFNDEWRQWNNLRLRPGKSYNEVTIEDMGSELLDGEVTAYHDDDRVCPCGGYIDDYGQCQSCDKTYEFIS